MNIYYIPFEDQFIIYRPLRPLAFLGNLALVSYLQQRIAGDIERDTNTESLLDAVDFWEPDPLPPEEWVPTPDHRPSAGVLLMTSACNLRCTYCYAFGGEGPLRQMTLPLARTVIDTVSQNALLNGEDEFSLTFHGGGEPTVNWEVLTGAIEYAMQKELPCKINMATNGIYSQEKLDFIIQHFSEVSLSFDGMEEIQNQQRPKAGGLSSYEAVMQTIRAFDEHNFAYGVRMTVTPEFFSKMAQNVEFLCQETSCRGVQIEPTYTGERGGHADPDPAQSLAFIEGFQEAFEMACRYGMPLSYSGARPLVISTSFCKAASQALVVTPEGHLVTCFEVHDETHPLSEAFTVGKISPTDADGKLLTTLEEENLLPILGQNEARVQVDHHALTEFARKEIEKREECQACFCYWHCAGDCATRRNASATADFGRCHVNRELTKDQLAWYIAASGGVWRGNESPQESAFEIAPGLGS